MCFPHRAENTSQFRPDIRLAAHQLIIAASRSENGIQWERYAIPKIYGITAETWRALSALNVSFFLYVPYPMRAAARIRISYGTKSNVL